MSGGGVDRRLGGLGSGQGYRGWEWGKESVGRFEWSSGHTTNVTGQWIGHRPVEKEGVLETPVWKCIGKTREGLG